MPWKKGQSGNMKGRPREEESLTWLMKEFLKLPSTVEGKTNKQLFIEKAYQKAVKDGDAASIKLIWNYIDGLPRGDMGEGGKVQFFIDMGVNDKAKPKNKTSL